MVNREDLQKIMESGVGCDLVSTKTVESTLQEYAAAIRSAENGSLSELGLKKFFGEQKYSTSVYREIGSYTHNKMQWVLKEYWKELGFDFIFETEYGYNLEIPPQMMTIDISLGKTCKIYKEASLFFVKNNLQIVLEISHNEHNASWSYYIHHNGTEEDASRLYSDWQSLADKKNLYKNSKISGDCRFLDLSKSSWDDVIIEDEKKILIQANIAGLFINREVFKEFGIPVKRGIILHGPPGTGKTQCCKALASEAEGFSVLYVLPSDFDPGRGGVGRIAKMAKDLSPCLLIMEDIDFIAKDRQLGSAGSVIELMNYLDGLEEFGDIVTFGTTNHLDIIEDAIKNRPGRFDRTISIGKPGKKERAKMIRRFTSRFVIDGIDIDKLSENLGEKTDSLSGAHIKDLCNTAAAFAARDGSIEVREGKRVLVLKTKHFRRAVSEVGNKDFSTYSEMQSKSSGMGFGKTNNALTSIDDDDEAFI